MKKVLILELIVTLHIWAALTVPLTVREALYPGDQTGSTYTALRGIARTNEPFCMGVPLPDSAGITDPQTFTLSGATAAQFRILGKWPSGNIKWVKVCGILPTLTAGGTSTVTLQSGGGGNSGGSNILSGTTTITANTGAMAATVKAAGGFNGFDTVTVGSTPVVLTSSGPTRGLVMLGPDPAAAYPGNVTCLPQSGGSACTHVYSSANDTGSVSTIEENGPVMGVVRTVGNLTDASGNVYMHYTMRTEFYQGKTWTRNTVVLRNADLGTTNTFATAYKGFQSFELRLAANLSGTLNYALASYPGDASAGCTNGICTGTMGGTDNVYTYQGRSDYIPSVDFQGLNCGGGPGSNQCQDTFTADNGGVLQKNGNTISASTINQAPMGFADISNASGVGIAIGVEQMSARWPASLEFDNGGADVRIGIFPSENGNPRGGPGNGTYQVYQPWPQWYIQTQFVEFHATAPASLQSEFMKFQHHLVAAAQVSYYNSTSVFRYPLPTAADEDAFMVAAANAAVPFNGYPSKGAFCYNGGTSNCFLDANALAASVSDSMRMSRAYAWGAGGAGNQMEFRWSDLLMFLKRAHTGRFLNSKYFYLYQQSTVDWPHCDGASSTDSTVNGCTWRAQSSGLNGYGQPSAASANSTMAFRNWLDPLHLHWYGQLDYYFMTGDETIKEAIVPMKDWYMNTNSTQNGHVNTGSGEDGLGFVRAVGIEMMSAGLFSDYLKAIGDTSSAATVLAQGQTNFTKYALPNPCYSNYPAGCTMPPQVSTNPANIDPQGVNLYRGVVGSTAGRTGNLCTNNYYNGTSTWGFRIGQPFQHSIFIDGLLTLAKSSGPSWSNYLDAVDRAYGVSLWGLGKEAFNDNGSNSWFVGGSVDNPNTLTLNNGFAYLNASDFAQTCSSGTPVVSGATTNIGGTIYDQGNIAYYRATNYMFWYGRMVTNGALTANELRKLYVNMAWTAYQGGLVAPDWGTYQLGAIIYYLNHPTGQVLQDVPVTLTNQGGGTYQVTAVIPAGTTSIRLKWSPQIIANSGGFSTISPSAGDGLLGYDSFVTKTFALNPSTYATWFGATDATPSSFTVGSNTFSISTGNAGLTAANFSLKANFPSQNTGPATHLSLTGYPTPTAAAASHVVVVTALDANNQVATSYTGTVRLTTSDAAAVLPGAYSFQVGDAGVHTFTVTLNTAGNAQSITVTDTGSSSITGSQTGIQITAVQGTATHLSLSGYPTSTTPGTGHALTVQALDVGNTVATGYVGTVHFTSSDAAAVLPSNYTFQASDAGIHVFTVTLNSLGARSITATDTTTGSITGTQAGIQVNAAGNSSTSLKYVSGGNQPVSGGGAAGGSTVTWTQQSPNGTYPGIAGFSYILTDPVSNTVIVPGVPMGSGSIYASEWYSYSPGTNNFTLINGDGTDVAYLGCSPDRSNQPGNRHPYLQQTIDPIRNWLWISNGANQGCNAYTVNVSGNTVTASGPIFYGAWTGQAVSINGTNYTVTAASNDTTTISITPAAPAPLTGATLQLLSRVSQKDLYHMTLNSNLASDAWTQHFPSGLSSTSQVAAQMAFDAHSDVLFYYGGARGMHSVYCYSTGSLTVAQTQAGCTSANNYIAITPNNGVVNTSGANVTWVSGDDFSLLRPNDNIYVAYGFQPIQSITDSHHLVLGGSVGTFSNQNWYVQPAAVSGAALIFDPQTNTILLYGGGTQNGTYQNDTWAYNTQTMKWTRKGLQGITPPLETGSAQVAVTCLPVGGTCYYHQTTGTGAPQDFMYNTTTDTWSSVPSTGTGENSGLGSFMAYVPSCNCLVTYAINQGTPRMWVGALGTNTSNVSPSFANPLVVEATDANGNPMEGVAVTFTVTAGVATLPGGVSQVVVNTDSQGMASTRLTPGANPGVITVTASAGTLTGSPVVLTENGVRPCDLNSDGVVDSLDAQIAVNQALGISACGSADLQTNGQCNVVDVQRVINAKGSGTCVLGQ